MLLFVAAKISYKNLMAAKFRSFLTILGIIIGVASVIIVLSIGASAQALILDQVSGLGSNLIGVLPGAAEEDGPPASALGIVVTTLKNKDLEDVLNENNVSNVKAAAGYVSGSATVKSSTENFGASYQGVSASLINVEDSKVATGRFFSEEEEINGERVAVLGSSIAEELFSGNDPLGKTITLQDFNFKVIGVLSERGSVTFSSPDEIIYVPLSTAQKLLLGIDYLNFMRIKANSAENVDQVILEVKKTLRENHKIKSNQEDDFSARSTKQGVEVLSNITDVLKYFLVAIASISLLVGGVGVMNIMLISVNQRIREIGLRKAIGARNKDIIWQFLTEAIFITLVGGLVGILTGVLISYLIAFVIENLGYDWSFIVTFQSILIATVITVFVGIIFGIYPASKASKSSPMEALRYE